MITKKNIVLPNADVGSEIFLMLYENENDTIKSRINFRQNLFSFLIDGRKEIYNTQNPSFLSGNEFALITAPNCLMTEKRSSPGEHYKSILLFFSNKILDEFKLKHQSLIQKNSSNSPQDILIFSYDNYGLLFRSSLDSLLKNKHTLGLELLKTKFNEIMLYLLQSEPKKISALLDNRYHEHELVFKATIENNLYSQLDVEELAFLCNMSLSTFKRYFHLYYNTSPRKYFIHKKLEIADYLLTKGERPKDVFQKAGYKTLSNFIKAYKAHFGETPGRRKKV